MPYPESLKVLGVVVQQLTLESVQAWRREHCRGDSTELALARHLESIITTIQQEPGGRVQVFIEIIAKEKHRSDSYYFRLRRSGSRGWLRVEPS